MAKPRHTIRDERADPNESEKVYNRTFDARKAQLPENRRVLGHYYRIPYPSGDPRSAGGVDIDVSELTEELQDAVESGGSGSSGVRLEAVLTFPDTVPANTVINIQTGTYSGGGPATVVGDTMKLSPSGVEFAGDGRFEVTLNGQTLEKGATTGAKCANWASQTQLSLSVKIFPGNTLSIRGPDLT